MCQLGTMLQGSKNPPRKEQQQISKENWCSNRKNCHSQHGDADGCSLQSDRCRYLSGLICCLKELDVFDDTTQGGEEFLGHCGSSLSCCRPDLLALRTRKNRWLELRWCWQVPVAAISLRWERHWPSRKCACGLWHQGRMPHWVAATIGQRVGERTYVDLPLLRTLMTFRVEICFFDGIIHCPRKSVKSTNDFLNRPQPTWQGQCSRYSPDLS